MLAEGFTHVLFAGLQLGRVGNILRCASGVTLGMLVQGPLPAADGRAAVETLLGLYDQHSVSVAYRSQYLRDKAAAAAAGAPGTSSGAGVLVSEIVHDTFYPAVQEVGRLAQCSSPLEVHACCSAIVRALTVLCPKVPGADDLIPLASLALHCSVCLGRAAQTDPALAYFGKHLDAPQRVRLTTIACAVRDLANLCRFLPAFHRVCFDVPSYTTGSRPAESHRAVHARAPSDSRRCLHANHHDYGGHDGLHLACMVTAFAFMRL